MSARTTPLIPNRPGWIAVLAVLGATLAVLLVMGRPPICPCGTIRFWQGVVQSPENSQQVADWYSFSHIIHGLLFYAAAHFLWRKSRILARFSGRWAMALAVLAESAWEVLENSPIIIDRYRAVTISWGYSGDSIVNSLSDIGWMMAGWLLAVRLPVWASVILGTGFELFTLAMIRDNLTLNIVMLLWPLESVRQWQAG